MEERKHDENLSFIDYLKVGSAKEELMDIFELTLKQVHTKINNFQNDKRYEEMITKALKERKSFLANLKHEENKLFIELIQNEIFTNEDLALAFGLTIDEVRSKIINLQDDRHDNRYKELINKALKERKRFLENEEQNNIIELIVDGMKTCLTNVQIAITMDDKFTEHSIRNIITQLNKKFEKEPDKDIHGFLQAFEYRQSQGL